LTYTVLVYAKDPPYVVYIDAVQGTGIMSKNYFDKVGSRASPGSRSGQARGP